MNGVSPPRSHLDSVQVEPGIPASLSLACCLLLRLQVQPHSALLCHTCFSFILRIIVQYVLIILHNMMQNKTVMYSGTCALYVGINVQGSAGCRVPSVAPHYKSGTAGTRHCNNSNNNNNNNNNSTETTKTTKTTTTTTTTTTKTTTTTTTSFATDSDHRSIQ